MDGRFAAYVDAVFRHMWEDGRKMDDPEMIRAALDASGLDGTRTLQRIQDPAVKDRLLKNTEGSVARGTFGSPTFFVGEEMFFGKDRLGDVEEEIEAAKAARGGKAGGCGRVRCDAGYLPSGQRPANCLGSGWRGCNLPIPSSWRCPGEAFPSPRRSRPDCTLPWTWFSCASSARRISLSSPWAPWRMGRTPRSYSTRKLRRCWTSIRTISPRPPSASLPSSSGVGGSGRRCGR